MEAPEIEWSSLSLTRAVSAQTKEEAARIIAAQLLRKAEGPRHCPHTWKSVAQGLGIHTSEYHQRGAERGEYVASVDALTGHGFIAVNTVHPPRQQARAWVHELAHHTLHVWAPPQLHDAADVYRYADDPKNVRHQIARRVERIVFRTVRRRCRASSSLLLL